MIPCHNELHNLTQLLPRLMETLHRCSRVWEVVLADDGSTDASPALMSPLRAGPIAHA